MKRFSLPVAFAILGMLLSVLSGCGSGSGAVPVEGTVTYQGQPVAGLFLQFVPVAGGRPSTAATDANGHFVLQHSREETGAPVGKYNVTFDWEAQTENDKATDAVTAVLRKHGPEGTPLEVEITGQTQDLAIAVE